MHLHNVAEVICNSYALYSFIHSFILYVYRTTKIYKTEYKNGQKDRRDRDNNNNSLIIVTRKAHKVSSNTESESPNII